MLIAKDTLKELLKFYSDEKQEVIEFQLERMEKFILDNKEEYSNNTEYSKAIDSILTLIMKGELIKED